MSKFVQVVDSGGDTVLVNPDLVCFAYSSDPEATVVVFAATEGLKDGSRKLARKVLKVPLDRFRALLAGEAAG